MDARRVQPDDIATALNMANAYYGGNLTFKNGPDWTSGTVVRFTLRVESSGQAGAARGFSGRRSTSACWHAHRDVLAALFTLRPDAVVSTAVAKYEGASGFLDRFPDTAWRNVGSHMQPLYMVNACDCQADEEDNGPVVAGLEALIPG